MGRIAELIEKKAKGDISDDEKKELSQLLAESKAVNDGKPDEGDPAPAQPDVDEEDSLEKASKALADQVMSHSKGVEDKLDKVIASLKEQPEVKTPKNASPKIFINKALGEKTPEELNDIKVEIAERKSAGKKITEVSMSTVAFVKALIQKDYQTIHKLQPLLEGTGARGGFVVPEEFANMIVEDIRDQNIMRQLASVMTTTSDTLHLPSLASRPKAAFRAEAAVKSTSTVDFAENVFTPYSLAVIVGLSNELVADAKLGVGGSIVNYVANVMATSLSEREELAFWEGNGTGQPTGVDNYTLRTVAAGAGASDAARADAILAAYARTPQGYRNRASWVFNAGTMETISRLKDTTGNYLLSNLAGGPTMTLRGRPVYESNYLPGGTAFFGDFSFYQIVDREGINTRVSDEATVASQSAFERNLTFVRVEKRVDGELVLPAAITEVTGLGTP